MRYIFFAIISTVIGGLCLIVFEDETNLRSANINDFGCGREVMITVETGKPKKHIYLVENLVKATPHLSCRMWDTYKRVSEVALKKFIEEQNPSYQPVIHYYNSQAEQLDPIRPAQIVEEVAKSDALAVVGFAWSTMAGIATSRANSLKIPYISPTGVLKNIFAGDYSVSLGTPVWEAAKGLKYLLQKLEEPRLIIVEATNQIQEREYSDSIRNLYPNHISIQYQDSFPVERIQTVLSESTNNVVFIPGYTNVKEGISQIIKSFPLTKFVVGPQWSHDHRLLNFEAELYAISDYYNFIDNEIHNDVKDRWLSNGGEIIGGYLYSLYDALAFTLQALNDEHIRTRIDLITKIKNFGEYRGTKGNLRIENGRVSKPIYILKYKKGEGFRLIERI